MGAGDNTSEMLKDGLVEEKLENGGRYKYYLKLIILGNYVYREVYIIIRKYK